jgi:hypothetical protein
MHGVTKRKSEAYAEVCFESWLWTLDSRLIDEYDTWLNEDWGSHLDGKLHDDEKNY